MKATAAQSIQGGQYAGKWQHCKRGGGSWENQKAVVLRGAECKHVDSNQRIPKEGRWWVVLYPMGRFLLQGKNIVRKKRQIWQEVYKLRVAVINTTNSAKKGLCL